MSCVARQRSWTSEGKQNQSLLKIESRAAASGLRIVEHS